MMHDKITVPGGTIGELAVVEPNQTEWDQFTCRHRQGNLLQAYEWGALKAQFGWQPRRVAIAGPEGLLAGAQVLFRRRFGLSAAYTPRGPLLSGMEDVDRLLFQALDRLARRARAVFLRLEPNALERDPGSDALHSSLLLQAFRPADPLQPRSSIHLTLDRPEDQLLAGMSKGHRADIRRAARDGVTVRAGTLADFDAFYAILEATSARGNFGIHSQAYHEAAWRLFAQRDAACLLLAEREGEALAGALVFAWAGTAIYHSSGSTEAGLKSGAQHAIQWQALQWAKARGCAVYDFWGIPDTIGQAEAADEATRQHLEQAAHADPLYGVYRFKKGFGGNVVRFLPAYDYVYLPALYSFWRRRVST
jgi:lipid II:glycine glycyltransferase (peptidoglycan interpeptide bridge formation enzyme)